jgi:hypothetical protein
MATALEECTAFCSEFLLWPKGLNAKYIHKEVFPVYGGKCLSLKAVQKWVEKFSQIRSKAADNGRPGVEVPETTAIRVLCCKF